MSTPEEPDLGNVGEGDDEEKVQIIDGETKEWKRIPPKFVPTPFPVSVSS